MVLNSSGFHLNEYSHVNFFNGLATPILLLPTPNKVGVNIKPSTLYGNSPSLYRCQIKPHASNIEYLFCYLSLSGA